MDKTKDVQAFLFVSVDSSKLGWAYDNQKEEKIRERKEMRITQKNDFCFVFAGVGVGKGKPKNKKNNKIISRRKLFFLRS